MTAVQGEGDRTVCSNTRLEGDVPTTSKAQIIFYASDWLNRSQFFQLLKLQTADY